ncbi:MAG: hypothetical protein JXB62_17235 [Pirellulales bacterium]|nr:hypothetical protein [Pirellulales bacterium]
MLLDLDDREGIEDWLAEVDTEPPPENPFKRYVVRPHCDWQTAPETGRRLYRRFSCAGFVVECYRSVGINLVNTREADLPDVEYAMIKHAYPQVKDRANVQEAMGGLTLDDLGLGGDGPWQVVLAGYVFHALDEISDENPRAAPHAPASTAEAYYPKPLP